MLQPLHQRRDTTVRLRRLGVQCLPDVAKVGEVALAVFSCEHSRGETVRRGDALEECGDAAAGEYAGPLAQSCAEGVELLVVGGGKLLSAPADEVGQRGCAREAGSLRLLERGEQGQPVARGGRLEHADRAQQHHGHGRGVQRVADRDAVLVALHQNGDVGRLDPPLLVVGGDPGVGAQQADDVGGDVPGDERTDVAHCQGFVRLLDAECLARDRADAQRSIDGCPGEARVGVARDDLVHEDARVSERDVADHMSEGVDQRPVAAPVGAQRRLRRRGLGGEQVGDHVGAAERVDGLLRVADQHQGAVAVERALQDLPLHRVGVLELVDEHDLVAAADAGARVLPGLGVGERVAQVDEQVVVVHHPHGALALGHGVTGALGEAVADCRLRVGGAVGVGGLQTGCGVTDCVTGHLGRDAELQRRPCGVRAAVVGDVQVGGDVGDQVAGPLSERHVVVDIGRDPHARQHLVAETVRGGNGGGVEVGGRSGKPPPACVDVAVGALRHVGDEVVLRPPRGADVVQACRHLNKPLADALAQLGGGGAAERDEHQLVDTCHTLGEIADREPGDGVGLPCARAGLEHGRALGQGPAQVEDGWARRHFSRLISASSSGDHTRRASCPNMCGSSG